MTWVNLVWRSRGFVIICEHSKCYNILLLAVDSFELLLDCLLFLRLSSVLCFLDLRLFFPLTNPELRRGVFFSGLLSPLFNKDGIEGWKAGLLGNCGGDSCSESAMAPLRVWCITQGADLGVLLSLRIPCILLFGLRGTLVWGGFVLFVDSSLSTETLRLLARSIASLTLGDVALFFFGMSSRGGMLSRIERSSSDSSNDVDTFLLLL